MAIHIENQETIQGGLAKGIYESAANLVLDTLQKYQYQYPQKSTVRELVSNALDSISEKQVALKILRKQAKVEDFFVEMEGELYKDSRFDPSYYSLNWLKEGDDSARIYYVDGGMNKDKVIVTDYGVGMSPKRLEGYFQLMYSTKRLSKLPLGKFGVGGKSPLSTGVSFYTIESRYNGMKFRFNAYSNTTQSIIPKINLATNRENKSLVIGKKADGSDYLVYYEDTTDKNGVTVELEVKRHHKQQYIDAVKQQLLYFPNVELYVRDEYGRDTHEPHYAKIIYEDDFIVMSDNTYWSKPHLLLNGVNYGYVNWEELELEDKTGNIGIKVAPEDVEVNPSRENVLWSEQTKKMVLERFNSVVQIATRFVQEELKETDFVRWLKSCITVAGNRYSRGTNSVLSRLANIVDLTQIEPSFPGNPVIKFGRNTGDFEGIYVRHVVKENRLVKNVNKTTITRKELKQFYFSGYVSSKIVLMTENERSSNRKDKFLLTMYDSLLAIYKPSNSREEMILAGISEEAIDGLTAERAKSKRFATVQDIWSALLASAEVIQYKNVEVPDVFTGTEEEELEELEEEDLSETEIEERQEEEKIKKQTAEQRRKLEGKTIIYTPNALEGFSKKNQGDKTISTAFTFPSIEIPIKSINDWEAEEVYYGTEVDEEAMVLAAMLTRDKSIKNTAGNPRRHYADGWSQWSNSKYFRTHQGDKNFHGYSFNMQHFYDAKVILVKVAQGNRKYYRDFLHIQQFFLRITNNRITMSMQLIKWNTARLLVQRLAPADFLYNFELFSQKHSDMYNELTDYISENYRDLSKFDGLYGAQSGTFETQLVNHLDKVRNFQEFVATHPDDKETIAKLALEMFGNKEIKDGMAVDVEIMDKLQVVLDYANGCGDMLNYIPILTGLIIAHKRTVYNIFDTRAKFSVPEELEQNIHSWLEHRGMVTNREMLGFDAEAAADAALQEMDDQAEYALEEADIQ